MTKAIIRNFMNRSCVAMIVKIAKRLVLSTLHTWVKKIQATTQQVLQAQEDDVGGGNCLAVLHLLSGNWLGAIKS